jgi:LPS-assembly protein
MLPPRSLPPLCSPSRRWQACRLALGLLAAALLAGRARADGLLCPSNEASATGVLARETVPSLNAGLDITSDRATVGASGNAVLKGHVVARQGNREVEADEAHYDRSTNALSVKGAVTYQDPVVRLSGSAGTYSPSAGAKIRSARFALRRRYGRGSAQLLNLTPSGVLDLKGVTFTTCQAADQSWQLRARSLTLDTGKQVGTGRDARIDFKGLPILYLPWFSFPLSKERKSGFLFPSIGNSSLSGAEIEIPYYWNIAPNADLTFSPLYYSRRGIDLAGDARLLTNNDEGELEWHYMPYDQLAGRDRSLITLEDVMSLPANLRLRIDASDVSDPNYFEDFGNGPASTSTAFLRRLVEVTYRDESWNLGVQAQQYQPVAVQLPSDYLPGLYRPYSLAPRVYADGDFGWGPAGILHYGFDSELVDFTRSVGISGWRLDLRPNVGLDYEDPAYFVRANLAWRYTQYELHDVLPGTERSPSRTLPIASFDAGLKFDRLLGARDRETLTLEPRLLYLYVPYRNQGDLPLFDTALPDLNLVELFRANRYVGADRVSDADQFTFGLTSRLFDTSSGRQYLSASLGQAFYLRTPRVELPGENLGNRRESDLVGEFVVSAYQNWNVDLNLDWNPATSQEDRTFVQLQYKPASESVINVGYRFQRNVVLPSSLAAQGEIPDSIGPVSSDLPGQSLEQGEVSGAWPIGRHWHILGRWVYDLDAHKSLDRLAGFEYRACCWRIRILARRYQINGTGQQDTAVLFQLQLSGLAGVGPATDAFLGTAIRGYSASSSER